MGLLDRMIGRNVEKYLSSMLATGQTDAEFPNLVFDAARVYAQNNGAKYYADMRDSIGFDKEFKGKNYNVFFMKGRGGRGTSVTLKQQPSARDRMESEIRALTPSREEHSIEFQSALTELDKLSETDVNRKRPSWDGDHKSMADFTTFLSDGLTKSRIPTAYWAMLLQTPQARGLMLSFVSILEDNGAPVPIQKLCAVRFIGHMWERLSPEHKSQFEAYGRT
ncbi:hypothetical protein [Sphingomonas faeni]|uniref:hypothetical protein n=1 Tax=Sphingomonas faeni TaxID=185950 RepID=UPI0020BDF449|nr:hypothetical protein [Sphingomonas faeni]MCK8458699.1 hypothetical protein [Sphingomonas faeni]